MADNVPHQNIRSIIGLSERRRLPRLGKIRLGIKKTGPSGQYPAEVDFFVVPPEVARAYGSAPKALRIMIPLEDSSQVFPQAYKWYGLSSGLKCKGNGQVALRRWEDVEPAMKTKIGGTHDPNDLVEIPCPCPLLKSGDCRVKGHLMVLLPDVSLSGVYQIDTGSSYNLIEINSSIDFLRAVLGRIAMVPLTLRREPTELTYQGKRRLHYLLKLSFDGDLEAVQRVREAAAGSIVPILALPIPSDEGNGLITDTSAEATGTPQPRESPTAAAAPPATPPTPVQEPPSTAAPPTVVPPVAPPPTPAPPIEPPPAATPDSPRPTPPAPAPEPAAAAGPKPPKPPGAAPQCSCGATVTANVADYSQRYFKEIVCLNCQKKRFGKVSGGRK